MSFDPKNNPELYSKVAVAKNRTLCLQHQIEELQKQQKQAIEDLQKICPHPVIIEFQHWTWEAPDYPRIAHSICSFRRFCCVCHENESIIFLSKTKFLPNNSEQPPVPADKQFKILTSLPDIIFVPNNPEEFCKTMEEFDNKMKEFLNLPLHELLKMVKKDQ